MVEYAGEPTLGEATFILKNEGNPTHPDFRVWHSIRPLYVYAHDDLMDHKDWNMAGARDQIIWQARYLNILPSLGVLHAPPASDVGMHLIDAPTIGDEEMNEDENEVEEEEEEDPEEDPDWPIEEVPRTPTPPAATPEHHDPLPDQMVWDFDRDLEIPNSGRVEPELDPTVWRDVCLEDECPQRVDAMVLEPVMQEPLERIDEEEEMRIEAQERVNRLWEEAGRELSLEENVRNETEGGMNEVVGDQENSYEVREEEEEEGEDEKQEPLVRPTRRRRLIVRAYLSEGMIVFLPTEEDSLALLRTTLSEP